MIMSRMKTAMQIYYRLMKRTCRRKSSVRTFTSIALTVERVQIRGRTWRTESGGDCTVIISKHGYRRTARLTLITIFL